jgi:hypothetical protein
MSNKIVKYNKLIAQMHKLCIFLQLNFSIYEHRFRTKGLYYSEIIDIPVVCHSIDGFITFEN